MSSEKRERWRREEDEESTGETREVEEREKRRSGEEERERSPTSPVMRARACAGEQGGEERKKLRGRERTPLATEIISVARERGEEREKDRKTERKFSVARERRGERETGRGNSSRDGNYFRRERGRSSLERERERLATEFPSRERER